MIRPLPHWVLTNRYPAFYDTESVTAIEMVAKLYGSMEELIKDYNTFIDNVNKEIEEFENSINKDFDKFKDCVKKLMSDYIETIDMKINLQDAKIDNAINSQNQAIEEAIQYMKDNIVATTTALFEEYLQSGDIFVALKTSYDEETKALTLGIEATPSNELLERLEALSTPEDGE